MEKISRRSFIKRSGAVTLGSVLGLGMLPSVTRKLQAGDVSESILRGVSFSWGVTEISSGPLGYCGGTMELKIKLTPGAPKNQCEFAGVMKVKRSASFSIVENGKTFAGEASREFTYNWLCYNGVPTVNSIDEPGASEAPIKNVNNPNEIWGSVSVGTPTSPPHNETTTTGKISRAGGKWTAPTPSFGPLSYSTGCCSVV
jgi:hypothetical protein